ncbi:SOS response-associated peptidase family protein [Kangiella sediminilitoris]|uniref:Abasic site processing protein n=1 Tax=Kangiella sediminilitoris TaxID=1144748 RepID=A0A1B3BCQ2_9GAMM|nr:SOS response-associated peptidase family protein [Kangiella sediminilitoris]AOE50535.1 hypothetical protein KS2013_1826 [Kangiella sediminilitoris]
MCGFIELVKKPAKKIEQKLDLQVPLELGSFKCYHPIQIIHSAEQGTKGLNNQVTKAMWQFLLEQKDGEWKPSKYTSFNSRWYEGKGFKKSFTKAYRETRCIIPASGFVEGMNKVYHLLTPADGSPIYFGGLFKNWGDEDNPVYSASMITIPGHKKLADIHQKAMPLMLPEKDLEMWLDPSFKNTDAFTDLMQPKIRQDFEAVKIKGWSNLEAVEDGFEIKAD